MNTESPLARRCCVSTLCLVPSSTLFLLCLTALLLKERQGLEASTTSSQHQPLSTLLFFSCSLCLLFFSPFSFVSIRNWALTSHRLMVGTSGLLISLSGATEAYCASSPEEKKTICRLLASTVKIRSSPSTFHLFRLPCLPLCISLASHK